MGSKSATGVTTAGKVLISNGWHPDVCGPVELVQPNGCSFRALELHQTCHWQCFPCRRFSASTPHVIEHHRSKGYETSFPAVPRMASSNGRTPSLHQCTRREIDPIQEITDQYLCFLLHQKSWRRLSVSNWENKLSDTYRKSNQAFVRLTARFHNSPDYYTPCTRLWTMARTYSQCSTTYLRHHNLTGSGIGAFLQRWNI